MTIEKLEEFASDGDKHLTGLDVATGFPRADKPERPWFNKLFGDITGKINEVVDNIDGLPPFEGGVLADTFVVVDGSLSQRTINRGLESIADLSTINNPKDGLRVYVKSYHAGLKKGGGWFTYDSARVAENDGVTVLNGWARELGYFITPYMAGAKTDGSDSTQALRATFAASSLQKLKISGQGATFKASNLIVSSDLYLSGISIEQNKFDVMESILTTITGLKAAVENVTLLNVNLDAKRAQHINVGSQMDGGRCCFLVQRPIKGLTIKGGKWKNAVTDGLMLYPIAWNVDVWEHWVQDVVIEDLESVGHGRWGGSADSVNNMTMLRCKFKNNGLDIGDTPDYTTGLAARRVFDKLYGGGFDLEEYEGRAYSNNINIIDCDMRDNAGIGLVFTRTGVIERPSTNITISGGQYDYGSVVDSHNPTKISIGLLVYSATGTLDAFNAIVENVDLGGGILQFDRTQKGSVSNLTSLTGITLDQSAVKGDANYPITYVSGSNESYDYGIKSKGEDFLGNNNQQSTVWLHTKNEEANSSKLAIRAGGIDIGGIEFEKSAGSAVEGVNFHFTNGAVTHTTIGQYGNIFPIDNSGSIGLASRRYKEAFFATAPSVTSDETLKTTITELDAAEKSAALKIKATIGKYQFKDAVLEKGADKARYHIGVGAQTVASIMRDEGLDPAKYSFFCYDKWDAETAILDDEGNIIKEAREAGARYAIRYEELIMFILAAT